ncbi:MAG: energy-coupling factor transporter ATPase [Clostridia bacterium]|nr:energy-coupling factor transporter ATPase [Clostridia bacterium]
MSVIIKNLSYVYSPRSPYETRALDGISLEINDGDFFGIIGHTGSGKSTLINHLNALARVQKKYNENATLEVCGIDLTAKKPNLKLLREKVGMVFQYPEYQLFADTVKADVGYGAKNLGLDKEEIEIRVRDAIAKVGLNYDEVAERSPFELSGGQKRRVAIAGVIVMRPELLILDEPTAGLDPRGKKEILDLVHSLKQTCPTIVMVSHNMDEVADCCNRVAVLGGGKVTGIYAPQELFAHRELINSLGLELPTVTELAQYLAQRGLPVSPSVIREEELVEALLKR